MKRPIRRFLRLFDTPKRKRLRAVRALHRIFDPAWYLKEYDDVTIAKVDPLVHFLNQGVHEGRRPNRFFDPDWYGRAYPEIGRDIPIIHYATKGRKAHYDPGPEFSAAAYLAAHPDVAKNGVEPLEHFMQYGHKEARQIFPAGFTRMSGDNVGESVRIYAEPPVPLRSDLDRRAEAMFRQRSFPRPPASRSLALTSDRTSG